MLNNSPVRVLCITSLLLAGGCSQNQPPEAGTLVRQAVALQSIVRQNGFEVPREMAGLVTAGQSTDLGFELAGKVFELLVDEGDPVKLGQLLARQDTRLLAAARAELEGTAQEIEAALALNAANNLRNADLMARGFASQQSSDQLRAERDSLRARLAQVGAALEANRARQDKARLFAPYAATISRRLVDEGAVVAAGTPVYQLLEASAAEARVGVPIALTRKMAAGDEVTLLVGGRVRPGRILSIGDRVSANTLTIGVRIALAGDEQSIPGDQAYLQLDEQVDTEGFWVPLEALTDGLRGLWNVYVAMPLAESDQYILQARDVRVLYADTERAYVDGALNRQELIVAAGVHRLVPGQQVASAPAER